jgi:uncharacterized protein YbcC (UPF0753/DUF2309 family)
MTITSSINHAKRVIKTKSNASSSAKDSLEEIVKKAASKIAPVWPLNTAIACNPLLGLENMNFWQAIQHIESLNDQFYEETEIQNYLRVVNEPFIKWLKAFLDENQAVFKMPSKSDGFFKAWKKIVIFDNKIIQNKEKKKFLENIPENALDALDYGLRYLQIPKELYEKYFSFHLNALPGFCGYIKWKNEWNFGASDNTPIDFIDVLATRVLITILLLEKHTSSFFNILHKKHERLVLCKKENIENQEKSYFQLLHNKIKNSKNTIVGAMEKAKVQLVFCIDVRSEPLRRALEKRKIFETFGFAGFFGLPVTLQPTDLSPSISCPCLFKETYLLTNIKESNKTFGEQVRNFKKQSTNFSKRLFKDLKYNFATAFTLAESLGAFCGLWMAVKTFLPKSANKLKNLLTFAPEKQLSSCQLDISAIPFDVQLEIAYKNLSAIGLVDNFSPLIVIAGHKSINTNNSYASSLDCGACGANPGGLNAKLFVEILNNIAIRTGLKEKGIIIAKTTTFIAAEHNTVTHELDFISDTTLSSEAFESINLLKKALNEISDELSSHNNKEKCYDWSEIRPEMGLCKNASFIIGPRNLTKSIDLQAKAFLHSYDPTIDPDGVNLQQILQGPLIVAEWINMQYFFSTYNHTLFGSGSKLSHNIVGNFGVMQGNLSDLMHGLSFESVFANDHEHFHVPMRVQTFIYASLEIVRNIFINNTKLRTLVSNEWIHVYAIDPISLDTFKLDKNMNMQAIDTSSGIDDGLVQK